MSYRKGRRLEYRVRDLFRRRGWMVIRAAASKPIDLVCIRRGETVLVECKYGREAVRWAEITPLLDITNRSGVKSILAIAGKRGRIRMREVETWTDFNP
jgi:Holliday junction resolvase